MYVYYVVGLWIPPEMSLPYYEKDPDLVEAIVASSDRVQLVKKVGVLVYIPQVIDIVNMQFKVISHFFNFPYPKLWLI